MLSSGLQTIDCGYPMGSFQNTLSVKWSLKVFHLDKLREREYVLAVSDRFAALGNLAEPVAL